MGLEIKKKKEIVHDTKYVKILVLKNSTTKPFGKDIWFKNESSSRHHFPTQMSSPFNLRKLLDIPIIFSPKTPPF